MNLIFSNMLLHTGQVIINNTNNLNSVSIKTFYNNDKLPKTKNKILLYFIKHSRIKHINTDFKYSNEFVKNYCKKFHPRTKQKKLFYPGEGISIRGVSSNYYGEKISISIQKAYNEQFDVLHIELKKC